MNAILPQSAPGSYSGQWLLSFPKEQGLKQGSIARNGLAVSAQLGGLTFDSEVSRGNRAPARGKFALRRKGKCASTVLTVD
jgi:hypothetical protein